MKVSVIVPVFNVEKYIDKCLNSLVNQTLNDIEIIVVNDGSPDNSQKIIDRYAKKFPKKIKSFIKENGGLSSARNYGLKHAKGEFISFVDSDDWLDLDALFNMYTLAVKNNSDVVICDMVDHYENGKSVYHNCTKFNSIYEVTPSACNKIFKRKFIKNIKFTEGIWYEDLDFTTKLFLSGAKVSTLSSGLYNCNSRNDSIMNNNNSIKNLDIITVIENIKKFAKNNELYNDNIFSFLIFHHILITSVNRVARQKSIDKKKVLNSLIKYCHDNISNYKKMPFYSSIPRNRRIIARLNFIGLYNISRILLYFKSKVR